jgi:hypothetical protein
MDGTGWAGLGAHVCIVGWPDNCGSARNLGFLSISITDAVRSDAMRQRDGGVARPLRRPPGQARIDVGCGSKLVQLKCDVDDPILALRTSLESALLEHFQHRGVFWKHLCD